MKKIRKGTQAGDAKKVTALVTKLNRYRHEYYNLAAPSVRMRCMTISLTNCRNLRKGQASSSAILPHRR